jgi:hypothetical protein
METANSTESDCRRNGGKKGGSMNAINQKSESPERETQGSQNRTEKIIEASISQHTKSVNDTRFLALLEVHVSELIVRGRKAIGLCPLHPDRSPSFSADLEKGVWYCFPCARGGGIKDFALAVGEPWGVTHHSSRERARFAVLARRREAEAKARAILQRRRDKRDVTLWAAWCVANTTATEAVEMLALFFRRPDLAEEFSVLVDRTESEYSEAVFRKMVLEAQFAGEVGG